MPDARGSIEFRRLAGADLPSPSFPLSNCAVNAEEPTTGGGGDLRPKSSCDGLCEGTFCAMEVEEDWGMSGSGDLNDRANDEEPALGGILGMDGECEAGIGDGPATPSLVLDTGGALIGDDMEDRVGRGGKVKLSDLSDDVLAAR